MEKAKIVLCGFAWHHGYMCAVYDDERVTGPQERRKEYSDRYDLEWDKWQEIEAIARAIGCFDEVNRWNAEGMAAAHM